MDPTREYRHISTVLAREDSDLNDSERLNLTRRLTELAPTQPDSWWSLATQIGWMLRDLDGERLRDHTLFPELTSAWEHATALDDSDAAAPYNNATVLRRAGLLQDAYAAFMLAGRMESAHPTADIEWPAQWHFEAAADVALECGNRELALAAATAAIAAGSGDPDEEALLRRIQQALVRPSEQAPQPDAP